MLALLLGLMALTGVRVSNNASNQNERSMLTIKSQNENADTKKIEALPAKCAALAAIYRRTTSEFSHSQRQRHKRQRHLVGIQAK